MFGLPECKCEIRVQIAVIGWRVRLGISVAGERSVRDA